MELVNERLAEQEKIDESRFSVEWMVDDERTLIKKIMRDFNGEGRIWLQRVMAETIGLPKEMTQLKKQLGLLNTFNDPKGQYLYCLTCGSVK